MSLVIDPRIDILLTLLQRYRGEVARSLESVPHDRRDVRPTDGTWSAANVLEHLASTERGVTALLSRFTAGSEQRVDVDFDHTAFELDIEMPFFLDRSRKLRGSQPTGELSAADAWDALEISRGKLLAALDHARGRRLEGRSRAHPATGGELNAYQWIAFIALHEGRHAAQLAAMVA